MKAIVYERTGPPDVLRVVDRPVVEPGPDEVRVRIAVSGVNPTDWKARAGTGTTKELAELRSRVRTVPEPWMSSDRT